MDWFDKLLRDLDNNEESSEGFNILADTFQSVFDTIEDNHESTCISHKLLKASLEHDKLVVDAMRKVCDEAEGDLFVYLRDKFGLQEANYLSFQISNLIELLLKRNVSTTLMVKAALERPDVQDKSTDS